MRLGDAVSVNKRFSRSANVERDTGVSSIEGYIPTGRALDVVGRISRGLSDPAAGRAFSITGPHGGGKSSLAVFLDALFAPRDSAEHAAATSILEAADTSAAERALAGLHAVDRDGRGAVRALVTAGREPVTVTVARALHAGAVRTLGPRQRLVPKTFGQDETAIALTAREILDALRKLCSHNVVVLVIDEFGKNLEAYAESGREGDPYLLQELAEATQGQDALPFVLVTMQHLSFDEYVQEASAARRREWAKVQGRFQDIPYVETAIQARRLIAATIDRRPTELDEALDQWFDAHIDRFSDVGLRELAEQAQGTYPLHPLALALLPDLCSRYGQNERTLFSFLAGSEPLAVPEFLERDWVPGDELSFVGLDRVYDYFLDSASTTIGASATASRWLEIEGRIRDTTGLTAAQLRTLKTVGVLNLVSSGGTLRSSRQLLDLALLDGQHGLATPGDLGHTLASLEARGLITYRDFADEFRIWQGSDFDLRASVDVARRACESRSLASLLNEAAPLVPAVAGRNSQLSGVLRVFEQRFSDLRVEDLAPPGSANPSDGIVLYATSSELPSIKLSRSDKALIVVVPDSPDLVREAAVDAAALRVALSSAESGNADWVARRELIERVSAAAQQLRVEIANCWSPQTTTWHLINDHSVIDSRPGVSSALSTAADVVYSQTPRVANEMIARRELTSQGAKARRMLIEAFLEKPGVDSFGIGGYGPDRAMYEALFRATGLHRRRKGDEDWSIHTPTDRAWRLVWKTVEASLKGAEDRRVNLDEVAELLKCPPIGLKDGLIPVLLVAALWRNSDEVALYEHGSLVLVLDDAVAERLARNLGHFTVRNSAASHGQRRVVVEALAERLGVQAQSEAPTFLQLARALFREVRSLPPYTQQTKTHLSASAMAVRTAFRTATEPDTLVFETLPIALGIKPFSAKQPRSVGAASEYAVLLADALLELRATYGSLVDRVALEIGTATATVGDLPDMKDRLAGQALNLQDRVLEPRLRALVGALSRQHLDSTAWLENVAMVVAEGNTPRSWTDDRAAGFQLQIAELGGALRRTQALLYDHLAKVNDGYATKRITLTSPDGSEKSEVISIRERDRVSVGAAIEPALVELETTFGSRDAACRTLLAWLATDQDSEVHEEVPMSPAEEA